MARFSSGWVKLHRRAIEEDIGRNVNLLAIWVTLLCWANRFESKIIGPDGPIIIHPGDVVIGMQKLAKHFGISKKTVFKWLHYLEKRGSIGIRRVTTGTIISICNWEEYQGFENEGVTEGKRQVNDRETTGKREVTLNGEEKKERIEEKKKYKKTGTQIEYPPIFVEFWEKYGKHGNKSKAFKVFQALNLNETETDALRRSIQSYYARKPDWQSPQHFSTFLNSDWRQYLEAQGPENPTVADIFDFLPHRQKKEGGAN